MVHSQINSVNIREATERDFDWVTQIMDAALKPYYDGDHRAHAKRIFNAHLKGGMDNIGFFSFEQKMFVATINESPVGIIHVVGKRQQTYKISPLIVDEGFRNTKGIGSALLAHAEKYATSNGARQIYCTVALGNHSALQFFLKHGFISAGKSDSHYKVGSVETMLYKPIYNDEQISQIDKKHISVIPFEAKYASQASDLMLKKLPDSFDGITQTWLNALYDGYERRHSADVNMKYKIIFLAIDRQDNVIGVCAATPKKGQPIKLMPFIASDITAFSAMLSDLPIQFLPYGRKLYMHIIPSAEETQILQRHGWSLDAAMPSAYRPGLVTQQWSLNINEDTMRTLRVKERFFNLILNNKKDLEVRVAYDNIVRIQIGERIQLSTHTQSHVVKVKAIRRYDNFEQLLRNENYSRITPDSKSEAETLQILRNIYAPEKEKLGVVVLELSR